MAIGGFQFSDLEFFMVTTLPPRIDDGDQVEVLNVRDDPCISVEDVNQKPLSMFEPKFGEGRRGWERFVAYSLGYTFKSTPWSVWRTLTAVRPGRWVGSVQFLGCLACQIIQWRQ